MRSFDPCVFIEPLKFLQEVAAIAKQLLSADENLSDSGINIVQQQELSPNEQQHIPSPVKEPDPILSTCTTDWINEGAFAFNKNSFVAI